MQIQDVRKAIKTVFNEPDMSFERNNELQIAIRILYQWLLPSSHSQREVLDVEEKSTA